MIPYMHNLSDAPIDAAIYRKQWKRGVPGLADGDGHPYCYIIINSAATLRSLTYKRSKATSTWIGQIFQHGHEEFFAKGKGKGLAFKKSIRPTRKVFHGGLHSVGACKLSPTWDSCGDDKREVGVCYHQYGDLHRQKLDKFNNSIATSFHFNHRFDEVVWDEDAKTISVDQAYINHFQYFRLWFNASEETLSKSNEYSHQFFPNVLKGLDKRDLKLPFELKEVFDNNLHKSNTTWIDLVEFHKQLANSKRVNDSKIVDINEPYLNLENIHFPHFTNDQQQLILAAMIERSLGNQLFVTTMFLNISSISSIREQLKVIKGIKAEDQEFWRRLFDSTTLTFPNSVSFHCQMTINESLIYNSIGYLHPHELMYSLRCPLPIEIDDIHLVSLKLLKVDLIKEENNQRQLFSNFEIPCDSRVNSKYLTSSYLKHTWTSYSEGLSIIVPAMDKSPIRSNIANLLEFIEHHLVLGANHIVISTAFTPLSLEMIQIQEVLGKYINDGQVIILSEVVYDENDIFGAKGLSWTKNFSQLIQSTLISYWFRGLTSHVSIMSLNDRLVIPSQLESHHLQDDKISLTNSIMKLDSFAMTSSLHSDETPNWIGLQYNNKVFISTLKRCIYPINQIINPSIFLECNSLKSNSSSHSNNYLQLYHIDRFHDDLFSYNMINKLEYSYENQYSIYYFPRIYNALKVKNLDILVDIPSISKYIDIPEVLWIPFQKVWDEVIESLH